jgi:hypothetical protein
MSISASSKKPPLSFFVLVFALSIPFWVGAISGGGPGANARGTAGR